MGIRAGRRRAGAAVLALLPLLAVAACTAPARDAAGLRAELEATAPVDLREQDNATRDPRVVNAVWGDALLRRATPLTARPVPAAAGGPVATPPPSRPLLVTPSRAPLAGLPGASPATTPSDPRFARAVTGRLFLTMASVPRTCTAQVVASGTSSVLATAGHCLLSIGDGPRSPAQNLMFVPGYRDGTGPYGRWFADPGPDAVVVASGWQDRQDWSQDVGFVRLLPRGATSVQDLTGGLGVTFGEPGRPPVEVLGYPAAGRDDGARVQTCRTAAGGTGTGAGDPVDPQALGVPCAMTAGYSGGPWLAAGPPASMVAVSSHDYADGVVRGARLGPAALEAFRRADTPR